MDVWERRSGAYNHIRLLRMLCSLNTRCQSFRLSQSHFRSLCPALLEMSHSDSSQTSCNFARNGSRISKDSILVELKERIQFQRPISHAHRDMSCRLVFSEVRIH